MVLNFRIILEIIILWFIIYHIMLFFEGTRAINVLRGIILILLMFFIIQRLRLEILDWIFTKLFAISIIALLVIFHPEIRQGLAYLGKRHFLFRIALKEEELEHILKEIIKAVSNLSEKKLGALIAIENEISLKSYVESGVILDALVSSELIESIFAPMSPLHDGGLIVQQARITAGGCIFPVAEDPTLSREYGMRHRAGVGLSRETDAFVIIVSEERGSISLALAGRLYEGINKEELFMRIKEIMKLKRNRKE
ncbi:MAG: diadenylate cyclase CdaA [Candidatus Omnitrophica bacterium]|nr:diadenylate cyclase CdaA [Candidatus Omnitrophota bacterium]